MILYFHQENKILHFADDTTIHSCSLNYEEEHRKSSDDTHIVPNWFRINSMVANPGKFQIIFIRSSINNNNITFIVENKHIKSTNEVKLLENITDHKLTFTKHINNLCNTASKAFESFHKNNKIFISRANKTSF